MARSDLGRDIPCLVCGQPPRACECKNGPAIRRIAAFGYDPLADPPEVEARELEEGDDG